MCKRKDAAHEFDTGFRREDGGSMAVTKLEVVWEKRYVCPHCGRKLHYVEGDAVAVVDGRVDMNRTLPKYVCTSCKVYYRELLGSGYFEEYDMRDEVREKMASAAKAVQERAAKAAAAPAAAKPQRVVKPTGDLQPMILKREADGKCECPRCGDRMDFVEGQPVRIVDGKPDMENVMDHFHCPYCDSVFRRIATTDFFQYSEK